MIDREKFSSLRDEIIAERGDVTLFALFLREDAEDKWDVLVAAPWIEPDRQRALRYLSEKVAKKLTEQEVLDLSRIVLLEEGNPALEAFLRAVEVDDHSTTDVRASNFFGLAIKHAVIFQAKRTSSTPATTGA